MIIRIKRQKYFSDNYNNLDPNQNQKKKGMGTGTKLLMGATATAGLFYGARRGMFGAGTQMAANRLWARGGQMIGSQGMVNSARTKYSQGFVKSKIKAGQGKFKDVTVGSDQYKSLVSGVEQNITKAGNSKWQNNLTAFGDVNRQTAAIARPKASVNPAPVNHNTSTNWYNTDRSNIPNGGAFATPSYNYV